MHGATFTVDAEFRVSELAPKLNWVMDIGVASKMLADVLDKYNHSNLDDIFSENTTTEFMCKVTNLPTTTEWISHARERNRDERFLDFNLLQGMT